MSVSIAHGRWFRTASYLGMLIGLSEGLAVTSWEKELSTEALFVLTVPTLVYGLLVGAFVLGLGTLLQTRKWRNWEGVVRVVHTCSREAIYHVLPESLLLSSFAASWLFLFHRISSTPDSSIHPETILALSIVCVAGASLILRRFRSHLRQALLGPVVLLGIWVGLAWFSTSDGPEISNHDKESSHRPLPEGPNVLLIVLDTTRADHLSAYGHARGTTPFMTELAGESLLYDKAISPAPWTLPAHASIFTGKLPSEHGARTTHLWLSDEHVTLAELLRDAGYATVAFSSNSWVGPIFNLQQGFEEYFEIWKRLHHEASVHRLFLIHAIKHIMQYNPLKNMNILGDADSVDKGAGLIADLVPLWLERHRQEDSRRPFFMFINLLEAHLPYAPPTHFQNSFLEDPLRSNIVELTRPGWLRHAFRRMGQASSLSLEDLDQLSRLYDAELLYQDAMLRMIVEAFRERGLLDDTLLIVTADHGENLGEHGGLLDHCFSIHQSLLHVPLLVRYPDGRGASREIEEVVSTRRVFSTVLSATGVEESSETPSLLPALPTSPAVLTSTPSPTVLTSTSSPTATRAAGSQTASTSASSPSPPSPSSAVVSEYGLPVFQLSVLASEAPGVDVRRYAVEQWAIQDSRWKLTRRTGGQAQLFDLDSDPGELHPISVEEEPAGRILSRRMDEILKEASAPHPDTGVSGTGLDEDTRNSLRALGYLQ